MADQSLQRRLADSADTFLWTHRLGGLVSLREVLRERGVAPGPLLARAGLPDEALDSPDNRFPTEAVVRLLNHAVAATQCPSLGLEVGARWTQHDPDGLMLQRARCSATVGEALEALTVFQRLNSRAGAIYLLGHGANVTMGFAVFQPGLRETAVVYDVALASQVAAIREFLGSPGWSPDEVNLPRAQPKDTAPYRRFFGCRLRFDSEEACFRFPSSVMQRPTVHPDPHRARLLEAEALRALDTHLLPQLYRSLRLLLLDGAVSGDGIAQHLSMHRRTLDRRLRTLGTTFHAVLDEVRFDVARHLLAETNLTIGAIGRTIGYSEPSSFVRAFNQWAGTTPMKWRFANPRPGPGPVQNHPTG